MMIPMVVLVLALAASGFSLPLTTQGQVSSENVPQFFTEVPVTQFVEKTGVEGSPQTYSPVGGQVQANTPLPKTENVPSKVDQPQVSSPENPVLLPIRPLSVVPYGQGGQVFRPVIVPAEAITAGRVIIAGIETIQQRNFPEGETVNVENPVPYQQGFHPSTYTPVQVQGVQPYQQAYYAPTNEKQTPIVPTGQYTTGHSTGYTEPLIREQIVSVNPVPENVEQLQSYKPLPVEHNPQVYSLPQNVQPSIVQRPEKNVPYQGEIGYVPVQTVQQSVHEVGEKYVPYQQGTGYTPGQGQGVEPGTQYQTTSTLTENVEKGGSKYNEYQTQGYNVQGEKQGENYQVGSYKPGQGGVEKQGLTHTTGFQQQQVQTSQQGVETIEPIQREEPVESVNQQQVYNAKPFDQTHPVESVNQQVYNTQPVAADHVQSQVPHQQQHADYVQEGSKTSEVEHPEHQANYATEAGYNFGDKLPQQNTPVHTFSAIPQPQATSVQPSVVSPRE